jgi:o-succinylbenzoate synthase
MRIETITLRELRMRLKAPFETSSEVTWDRRVLLVEVGVDGLHGWGEITAAEDPFYNAETTDTAWHITRGLHRCPSSSGKALGRLLRSGLCWLQSAATRWRKAGVENAVWDIEAQQHGVPLAKLLSGTRQEIPCGVSIGIQPSTSTLLEKIECELRAGYQRIKLKIKPGKDVQVVAEVRRHYPGIRLMVDANSAYRLEDLDTQERLTNINS